METEASTRDSSKSELSTTPSEAKKAFDFRQQGKSLGFIIDNTRFRDAAQVNRAIKNYMMTLVTADEEQRADQLQLEVSRIDAVQDEMWTIMTQAEAPKDAIAAGRAVLQCIKERAELTGLKVVDPVSAGAQVLVVSGSEADYIATLQAAITK